MDRRRFSVEWGERGTFCAFEGSIRLEDIKDANRVLSDDARFYRNAYAIWDYSHADLSRVKGEELLLLVAMDLGASVSIVRFRVGIVVRDEYSRNLFQVYIRESERCGSPWSYRVFSDWNEALDWVQEEGA